MEVEETTESPKKLWADVIRGNRNPVNGLQMEFGALKVVNGEVEIEEDDIISKVKYWETALIMYAIGGELNMNMVKQFMIKNLSFVKLSDMYYNDDGYFILRFRYFQDKDAVLMKGAYSIHNKLMLLRDWKSYFKMKMDMFHATILIGLEEFE